MQNRTHLKLRKFKLDAASYGYYVLYIQAQKLYVPYQSLISN